LPPNVFDGPGGTYQTADGFGPPRTFARVTDSERGPTHEESPRHSIPHPNDIQALRSYAELYEY
jgi:hypothetical protein